MSERCITAAVSEQVHFLIEWPLIMEQAGSVCPARGHYRATDGLTQKKKKK